MSNEAYSIIIPCLNEEFYIGKLLQCLLAQSLKNIEIIVVDGNSVDKTREIVTQYVSNSEGVAVRLLVSDKRGVSHQRNLGASQAQFDKLLFLDADVQVKPNFLEQTIPEILERGLELATVQFKPLSVRVEDKFLYSFANSYISLLQFIEPVSLGWCIFSTKHVHTLINGFDEELTFGEDYNYVVRAAERGIKLKVLKKGRVYISVRRLSDEGRLNFAKKTIVAEVLRFMKGRVEKDQINYEFGKFKKDIDAMKFGDLDTGTQDMWKRLLQALNLNNKENS